MNERIKQLAEQCHHRYSEHNIDLEKFAQLIVGECYLWAKENGGLGCEEDFEALKEHFGVEQ